MSPLQAAIAGTATFLLSGLLSAIAPPRVTAALSVLAGGAITGAALWTLSGVPSPDLNVPWAVPGGSFHLALDPISAMFLVPVGILGALGAVYATRYWSQADHPRGHRLVRGAYGVTAAGMSLVLLAANGVVFLMAWEVMALSAFFLVATEHERADVRDAAYLYLAAAHVATLLLWILFSRIATATGTFGFAPLPHGAAATVTVLVGLTAFGIKAGTMPFHVWLPSAHACAPTHVSALLSGVILKVGIYGMVRTTALVAHPPPALAGLVLLVGAASAVGGVAFALGQHDIKRLLAYHSIENIGIIVLGIGLALLGRSLERPEWVVLGLAGALLHVWNHAFFKGLLFLAAGSVVHTTGTRTIDHLGGLARAMPFTATFFLVGALAISGLPPLNGFVSELMIYMGLIRAALPGGSMFAAFATPVLAMVGALAVACFVKVFGAVFLGSARTPAAQGAHEAPAAMLWPMGILAGLCVFIGLAPAVVAPALDRAVATFVATPGGVPAQLPALGSLVSFGWLMALGLGLVAATIVLTGSRWRELRTLADTETWSCGYGGGSPRLQYTASSFADLLVGILSGFLRPRRHLPRLSGIFPGRAHMEVHVDDVMLEGALRPSVVRASTLLARVRVLQGGHVNLYIFIILLGALALLLSAVPLLSAFRALWNG
ncbi:MAG: proton-conducting transporter membrane subunit [Longimicrobiales bacterium]|nr:proton-conducting transporter membrane subunit [Longimicrobiales bacterium]